MYPTYTTYPTLPDDDGTELSNLLPQPPLPAHLPPSTSDRGRIDDEEGQATSEEREVSRELALARLEGRVKEEKVPYDYLEKLERLRRAERRARRARMG